MDKILFAGMRGDAVDIRTDVPLGRTLYDVAVKLSDGGAYTSRDISEFIGTKISGKEYIKSLRQECGVMVFSAWSVGKNFDCFYLVRRVKHGKR